MSSNIQDQMLAISAQCVRCGMCLPHCPTNQLNNTEGQSPRGRIALWQNLAQNKLELTKQTHHYLSECLSCGACANNCPAGVKFLTLQDLGKQFLLETKTKTRKVKTTNKLTRLLITIFSSRILTNTLHYSLYIYQKLRLPFIINIALKPLPTFRQQIIKFNNIIPKLQLSTRLLSLYKTTAPNNSQSVILFTGCVNKLSDPNKITAAIKILNILGFNVHILNNLHCCGALYQHNGFINKYQKLSHSNKKTLTKFLNNNNKITAKLTAILTLDSGCHPSMQQQFIPKEPIKIINAEQFIYHYLTCDTKTPVLSKLINKTPEKLNTASNFIKTIHIYTPCSQREQLKTPNITVNLLNLILSNSANLINSSNYIIKAVPVGYGCCGAAGSYMFEHPQPSEKFAEKIINDFLIENPNLLIDINNAPDSHIICTSNIGCSMQFKNTLLEKYKIKIQVIHPLELFYKLIS